MSRSSIEMAIIDRVYEAEKINAAMVGYDRMDVAMMAFGAFCGAWCIANEPERAYVWQEPKMITGRG